MAVFKNGTDLLADKKLWVGGTQAKVELAAKPTGDECYYYLRVVTEKGIAWTSPVWISRK